MFTFDNLTFSKLKDFISYSTVGKTPAMIYMGMKVGKLFNVIKIF